MRLRSVAVPVFLVTVKPTPGTESETLTACKTKPRLATLLPRAAFKNCARLTRRRIGDAGFTGKSPENVMPTAACGQSHDGD